MRILIVSYYFPPFNTIGAVRVGKIARYLLAMGHDVRVVAACPPKLARTLPLEIPPERVRYAVRFAGVEHQPVFTAAGDGLRFLAAAPPPAPKGLAKALYGLGNKGLCWTPCALATARVFTRDWMPELIFGSYKPANAVLAAQALARELGAPWVAELRDLWTDNHYYAPTGLKRLTEARLERRVLSSAAGLVTVSAPLAAVLRGKYPAPAEVIYNGYDAGDYPDPRPAPAPGLPLRIVYTGELYGGRRDPSPLFAALPLLGADAAGVRVEFYGSGREAVLSLAAAHGVADRVLVHDAVPYGAALRAQCEADILLFLLWHDPRETGVFTGKFFEYLGARRPLLVLGPEDNVAARAVVERNAGAVANTPEAIAAHLRGWLAQKAAGGVPMLPEDTAAGFSRAEQVARLAAFFRTVTGRS
ncbi:MAG TPA: glycosyltransferase [Armatimonadota bacterium]|nr:glycosyltransferase [Armatimonadota bacterium]